MQKNLLTFRGSTDMIGNHAKRKSKTCCAITDSDGDVNYGGACGRAAVAGIDGLCF